MSTKKSKVVVIDTNKFLSLYDLSYKLLSDLDNLVQRIKKGEIRLVLPEQIIEEVERNRLEERYKEAVNAEKKKITRLEKSIEELSNFELDEKIKKTAVKSLKKKIAEHELRKKKLSTSYLEPLSKQNRLIKKLFDSAEVLPTTNEIMRAVEVRKMKRGYPREKNVHYGDAIVWETLLASDIKGEVILITANTNDWATTTGEFELNRALQAEWKKKKGGKVKLVKEIADVTSLTKKKKKELKEAEEKIYSLDADVKLASSVVVGYPPQGVFISDNDFPQILTSEVDSHSGCVGVPVLSTKLAVDDSILLSDLPEEKKMFCIQRGNPLPIDSLSTICPECTSKSNLR